MNVEQLLRENEAEPLDSPASVEAFVRRIAQVVHGGAPGYVEGGMTLQKATQSIGDKLAGARETRTESGMMRELESCRGELTELKVKFSALGKAAETMKEMLEKYRAQGQ